MPRIDQPRRIPVDRSDLEKVLDALDSNSHFHLARDEMNASLHLATQTRHSPLTSETLAARDRVRSVLNAANHEDPPRVPEPGALDEPWAGTD